MARPTSGGAAVGRAFLGCEFGLSPTVSPHDLDDSVVPHPSWVLSYEPRCNAFEKPKAIETIMLGHHD